MRTTVVLLVGDVYFLHISLCRQNDISTVTSLNQASHMHTSLLLLHIPHSIWHISFRSWRYNCDRFKEMSPTTGSKCYETLYLGHERKQYKYSVYKKMTNQYKTNRLYKTALVFYVCGFTFSSGDICIFFVVFIVASVACWASWTRPVACREPRR